eukprot:GILJ01002740.1.p1 GENE.GILJ01002740.1~~GILJ01002740.1.p1  ORF type:complete len:133 (-),score=0.14 GILJ01002740.1:267-665(-)
MLSTGASLVRIDGLQILLDVRFDCGRLCTWRVVPHHCSLPIQQKLFKVPCESLGFSCECVVNLGMRAKKLKNGVCRTAVHLHLRKQLELNIMFRCNTVLNLCVCARLLAQELVARKSENLQTLAVVFTMQFI